MEEQKPNPPMLTYISKEESESRITWYEQNKKPVLDAIVQKYAPGQKERSYFYYSDPRVFSKMFAEILDNKECCGLRIYLASYTDREYEHCDHDDKGKLVLIYVPTVLKDGEVINKPGEHYILKMSNCSMVKISLDLAKELVKNYQNEKRKALFPTLSKEDQQSNPPREETRFLFIEREKIQEIKDEINYQLRMSYDHGVAGVKVCLASFTDRFVERDNYKLCQRVSIHFVFTDDTGRDLHLEGIDDRYDIFIQKAITGAQNMLRPVPPYPPEEDTPLES